MMRATPSTGQTEAERRLRRRKIIAWVATLVVVCAVTSFSSGTRSGGYGVPSAPGAARSATTPLSTYENGTVATPNPIDNSSALIVTGNVAGGKHFQGSVPYRPLTSVDAPLGSTSLDPFLRRTAPSATSGDPAGASSPFYSQTGTVATATGGALGRGMGTTYTEGLSPSQYTLGSDLKLPSDSVASSSSLPAGDLAMGWQSSSSSDGPATRGDYDRQMAQLQERLARVKAELAQLERGLAAGDEPSGSSTPQQPVLPYSQTQIGQPGRVSETAQRDELLQETARLLSATMGLTDSTRQPGDAMPADSDAAVSFEAPGAQPRLRLYEEQDDAQTPAGAPLSIDALVTPRTRQAAGVGATRSLNELPAVERVNETARAFDGASALLTRPATSTPTQAFRREDPPNVDRVLDPVRAASPWQAAPPPTQGRVTAPAVSANDDSPAAKLFDRHFQEGYRLMQRRDYPRACEAFTLATAYRPHDARGYLGKGHALLAAGEYLDSALSVAKAVELDLPAVLQRTDLIQVVGGPDAFIAHFNELDRRIEADGGPQIQFLMAYIYYQMDRPQEAKVAIDAAQKLLPASMPIDLFRSALGSQVRGGSGL
jgi:hypothetical protein